MKQFQIITVLSFIASSLFAANPPTENQGAQAVAAKVREESNGLLRLYFSRKTNGQKSVVNGVEIYKMECSATVEANEDCAMTGFQLGGGWDGTFKALKAIKNADSLDAFNPSGAAFGTNKQLEGGETKSFKIEIVFDLTEQGWRTEGRLPPDKPYALDKNAASDHWDRGIELVQQKKFEDAVSELSEALKLNKHADGARLWRAKAYYALSRFDEALADISAAMRSEESAFHFEIRGKIYKKLGKHDMAKKDYERAQAQVPYERWE